MAASTKRKDRDDVNFLQSTWDLLADISNDQDVAIDVRLVPTARRGVFLIRMKAYRRDDKDGWVCFESYATEYPCAEVLELSAALFRGANKLDSQIAAGIMAKLEYKGGQP